MKSHFKKIGIIGRQNTPGTLDTLITLENFLNHKGLTLFFEQETASSLPKVNTHSVVTREELGKKADLIIVVGGDGSLLNAVHAIIDDNTPVLGINRGRLGFLTDIHPTELQAQINAVLEGQYEEEKRFLLQAEILRENNVILSHDALNEVVLYAGDVARMIEFEVYINDQYVYSQRSDGLIVATPTGSTAYALSGGGPILHPSLNAIVLVPMFPHTLTSRPIVIDADITIELVVAPSLEIYPGISCDGKPPTMLNSGDRIRINKKKQLLRLIHTKDYNFYQTLRTKLHWGTKWEVSL